MTNPSNKSIIQILNLLAVFVTILVNFLANALPLNGKYTGELSDAYPNLFVPSGLTFAIWGVIYLLLILFGIYQARDLFKKDKIAMPFLDRISYYFILASIANILWIFSWHYEQVLLSVVFMIVLLVSLLIIFLRLEIGKAILPRSERFYIQIPFSVYLGWITVATIANITALLVSFNWDGFGISEVIWTILVIVVALVITILMLITRKDVAYSLVILWALLGIYIKRTDPQYGVQNDIALTAIVSIAIILLAIIVEVGLDMFMIRKNN